MVYDPPGSPQILAIYRVNVWSHKGFVMVIKPFDMDLYDSFGVFKPILTDFNRFWIFLISVNPCRASKSLGIFLQILPDFGQNPEISKTFHYFYIDPKRWCLGESTRIDKIQNRPKCV